MTSVFDISTYTGINEVMMRDHSQISCAYTYHFVNHANGSALCPLSSSTRNLGTLKSLTPRLSSNITRQPKSLQLPCTLRFYTAYRYFRGSRGAQHALEPSYADYRFGVPVLVMDRSFDWVCLRK